MNWFFYLSFSVTLFAFLSSLKAFRLDKPYVLKCFSLFLLFVFLGEIFGVAWSKWVWKLTSYSQSNQWYYNLFHIACYGFYLYFFYHIIRRASIRLLIKGLAIIYILFGILNMLFIQGFFQFNTYTELLICFIMVFMSIAYFYQLLYAKEVISLKTDPLFWISTGVLIYHLGSMMGLFLINVMVVISNEKARDIHLIIRFSGLLMYISFAMAFLCMRRK